MNRPVLINEGDIDLIEELGRKLQISSQPLKNPFKFFAKDFNDSGSTDIVLVIPGGIITCSINNVPHNNYRSLKENQRFINILPRQINYHIF